MEQQRAKVTRTEQVKHSTTGHDGRQGAKGDAETMRDQAQQEAERDRRWNKEK